MDRTSFLSSLPFVLPVFFFFFFHGSNNPPTTLPLSSPPNDPGMVPIELCLEWTEKPPPMSHLSLSQRSTTTTTGRPRTATSPDGKASSTRGGGGGGMSETCTNVLARIQGQIYALDLTWLQEIRVVSCQEQDEKANATTTTTNPTGTGSETNGDNHNGVDTSWMEQGEGDESSRKRSFRSKKPSYLMLVFPSLWFRIFAWPMHSGLQDPNQPDDDDAAALYELETTRSRLWEALVDLQEQAQHTTTWELHNSTILEPTTTATTTTSPSSHSHSGSSQQQHQQTSFQGLGTILYDDEINGNSSNSDPRNDSILTGKQQQPPQDKSQQEQQDDRTTAAASKVTCRFQRRRDAYWLCHANLQATQALLEAPVSMFVSSSNDHETPGAHVRHELESLLTPLCTATATQLAASYVDPMVVTRHLQEGQEQQSNRMQTQLQPLLDHFFPLHHRRHRNRRGPRPSRTKPNSSLLSSPSTTTPQVPPIAASASTTTTTTTFDTIASVQALLDEYKKETRERHELLLLPQRKKLKL